MQKYLLTNCQIFTADEGRDDYNILKDGIIAINDKKIGWVGHKNSLPKEYFDIETVDLGKRIVTPALIDCHTHVLYGGNRAAEFEQRINGKSYEQIACEGGGIVATVNHTRNISQNDLITQSLPRIDAMLGCGVGTIEIKSGYGLNIETELMMLRCARKIEKLRPVRIKTSLLAMHALPKEFNDNISYIKEVCLPLLAQARQENLLDAVDAFCENIAFSTSEIAVMFAQAKELAIDIKLHTDQLSNIGGVKMALEYDAMSVDHLEYLADDDIKQLQYSSTVAVLLPGAYYYLGETKCLPIDKLRQSNIPMAVATDCNPGSSPLTSLLMAMNMACVMFKLTPLEALYGVTRNAAKALRLKNTGIIKENYQADLAVWDIDHPRDLAYYIGYNPLYKRIFRGKEC